jgi:hypothetical protein
MQIRFDQPASKRNDVIDIGSGPMPSRPRSVPATRPARQADSLVPYHVPTPAPTHSSPVASASMPEFQQAHAQMHAQAPELSRALQDAIAQDDWAAFAAARDVSTSARTDVLGLLRHAAQAGANHIVFRLQSERVSVFLPDMTSCAFYTSLKHGNYGVAQEMLKNHGVIERVALPDLKPCLEAAVDDNDRKAIAWLVDFSVKSRSGMPFELLGNAISESNARRLEIMISHPAFTAALKDPEAERLFLSHAIDEGTPFTLGLLLARKRCAKYVGSLCEKSGPKGNTLLHRAAASGDPAKLKLILDFDPSIPGEGASDSFFAKLMQSDGINVKNNQGKTALAMARDAGHTALDAMLRARGARL